MRFRLIFIFFMLSLAVSPASRAQSIRIDVQRVSLEEAITQFRLQTGIDVVFARRLVQGRTVSCHYSGEDPAEALACLLGDSGLRAEPVRRRQYVLIEETGVVEEAPRRGMLAGFIRDAESGEALPGAHVYLPGLRLGTVTNEAGYFGIADLPAGTYRVRYSYLSYETRDTTATVGAAPAVVRLRPATVQAAGLLVEGSRSSPAAGSMRSGVLGIPLQMLERLPSLPGEQDLFHSLQWLPGVHKSGEMSGELVVRGGEPDQNLYLLDGAPVYHPWHAFSLISTFQTETFKDVRFYRGALPAEHGGRLSSVLDVQMKDGSRTRTQAVAALSAFSGRFMVESPLTRHSSFMISGRRSYLDKLIGTEHPVEGPDGRRDTLRTGYYFSDLSAKFSYRPGVRHQLSFSHYRGWDALDLRLPFDLSLDFSSWLRPAELFFEVDQGWGNQVYSARHQYLHPRQFFVTTTVYYSGYRANEGALIQPTSSASLASIYRVHLQDRGVKVDVDLFPAPAHQVRTGLQFVHHDVRSSLDAAVQRSPGAVDALAQESRLRAWELVGYVQDTWQPGMRWLVVPGLRGSFFSGGAYAALNPRLDVRYTLKPGSLSFYGAAGTQVQYMHRLRDRYSFMYDLVSSRWIPASAAVRPSASIHVETGVEAAPLPWLRLEAGLYGRYAENVLLPEDAYRTKDGLEGPGIEVGALLGQYVPAYARAYGTELSMRVERQRLQLWLTYVGGRSLARVPAAGEMQYRPARFDVPRSFRGVAAYTFRRWVFTLAAELRSGYPHTVPVARYWIGDPLDPPGSYLYRPHVNNGRLPPYFRLDAAVGHRFRLLGASWQAQLHVYNTLNRRNVIGRMYDPAPPTVVPKDRRGLPLLPLFELEIAR